MLDEMGEGLMKIVLPNSNEKFADDLKTETLVGDDSNNFSAISVKKSGAATFKWNMIYTEADAKDPQTFLPAPVKQTIKLEVEGVKLNLKMEKKLEKISVILR